MRNALVAAVATLAVAATTACSEAASEPTAVETEALVATATSWTPSDLTHDLPVDDATRQQIEDGLRSLHASLLELHGRHETARTLEGEARAAHLDEMKADMEALHEQHRAVWDSLDPAVKELLAARLHERMREHHDDATSSHHEQMREHHGDDEAARSLHERMRRMHGGAHGAGEGH